MLKKGVKEFGIIFWLHLLLIFLIFLSPFLFKWEIILLFILLYYVQILIFGDCILTRVQFKIKGKMFHYYYLSKLGLKVNERKIRIVVTYIIPLVILLITVVWQMVLNKNPLF